MIKKKKQVGYTAILPSKTLNAGLPGEASIFTAEMFAVKTAIEELIKIHEPCSCIIFADSQSVLQAFKSKAYNSPMVTKIQQLLNPAYNNGIHINSLCWFPGPVGVAGNEKADDSAKSAAISGDRRARKILIPHTDMTGIIKAA